MQSRFGQILFGAALGVVTAAGLAGAMSAASGRMEVRKQISLVPAAASAQVSGRVNRTIRGLVQGANASAGTSNQPVVFKKGSGLAQAIAAASGKSKGTYLGEGDAAAFGLMGGSPIRLSKPRAMPAVAYATIQGQGFVYQLIEPAPAIAVATGFGTTYHLAYGTAAGAAHGQGQVVWTAGAAGEAVGVALIQDAVRYTASLYGVEAVAFATIRWESTITRGGRRYRDFWGAEAVGSAQAELTNWSYYPSVTAYAYAHCQANGFATVGGRGVAEATAQLEGTMIAASTSAGIVQSDSIAGAQGSLRAFPKGYGTAYASASGTAEPEVTKTDLGICEGVATSAVAQVTDAVIRNTKARPDDGYGVAQGYGTINRIRAMAGRTLECFAEAQAAATKIQFVHGVANGISQSSVTMFRITLAQAGEALATASLKARFQYGFYPQPAVASASVSDNPEKIHFASGEALAGASAVGGNQVNDAVKAPATRTVLVTQEPRTTPVLAESRTVVV